MIQVTTDRPARSRSSETARVFFVALNHLEWVVFSVALLPRLLFLFQLKRSSPTFDTPDGGDSILYDRIASGAALPAHAYFHSPLYIGFLRAFYRILGRDLFVLRLLQHVIGAASCALLAHLTLKLFRSRPMALGAGLLAAVLGPLVFYEGQLGVDALMPFLMVGSATLALRAWRKGDPLSYGLLGAAIGVAALGRAVALVWVVLLLVWAIGGKVLGWRQGAALVAGAILAILPVTIRNYRVERDLVPITANAGLNFYIGNNELANGAYVPPKGLAFQAGDVDADFEGRRAAEESVGRRLTSARVSAWWSRRAWTFILAQPGKAAGLALAKLQLLTSDVEYPQLHDYRVYREVAPILGVLPSAAFVVIPGLAGIVGLFLERERRPVLRRYVALVVAFGASFVPFFVVGRYRAPLLLLLAPFAVAWVERVVRLYREGGLRSLLVPTMLLAGAAWVSTIPIPVPATGFQYMAFAQASLANGDRQGAEHWCERVDPDDPKSVDAVSMLGRLRRQEGRYDDAEEVLAASVKRSPHNPAAWLELGRVRAETGHIDTAIKAYMASVEADPRSIEAWTALDEALHQAGRQEEADQADRSLARLRTSVERP